MIIVVEYTEKKEEQEEERGNPRNRNFLPLLSILFKFNDEEMNNEIITNPNCIEDS